MSSLDGDSSGPAEWCKVFQNPTKAGSTQPSNFHWASPSGCRHQINQLNGCFLWVRSTGDAQDPGPSVSGGLGTCGENGWWTVQHRRRLSKFKMEDLWVTEREPGVGWYHGIQNSHLGSVWPASITEREVIAIAPTGVRVTHLSVPFVEWRNSSYGILKWGK